jgi:hypothetical protein
MADLGVVKAVIVTFGGTSGISTASVVGTSNPYPMGRGPTTFQATVQTTSTGASAVITGAVTVQVSNDNVGWLPYGTCSATGSGSGSDGFAAVVPWAFSRMVISSLTTGVAATLQARIGM